CASENLVRFELRVQLTLTGRSVSSDTAFADRLIRLGDARRSGEFSRLDRVAGCALGRRVQRRDRSGPGSMKTTLEPPEKFHVVAAHGWLELRERGERKQRTNVSLAC